MDLFDLEADRDIAQDVFDRADKTVYQCSSCRFEYTRSRMATRNAQEDGRIYRVYFCPNCKNRIMRITGDYMVAE